MFWNRRNRTADNCAELRSDCDQWRRVAESAENREMHLRDEFDKVIDRLDTLYAVIFPGIEHTEDMLETVDALDRYITAQATELASLRAKILEASDLRETVQRSQEILLEIQDAVAEIRAEKDSESAPLPALIADAWIVRKWMSTPNEEGAHRNLPTEIFLACWRVACAVCAMKPVAVPEEKPETFARKMTDFFGNRNVCVVPESPRSILQNKFD